MRSVIGPIALGLLITATGCVESTGYPTTYGYGYQPQPTYYSARPAYYAPPVYQAPVYPAYQPVQTRYVAVPVYTAAPPRHHHHRPAWRDWDG